MAVIARQSPEHSEGTRRSNFSNVVFLPVFKQIASTSTRLVFEMTGAANGNFMNILVIDDDKLIRKVITELLESEGHTVLSAEDGYTGFNILSKERIDVCFLDLWMPKIGGIETLQKIKEDFPDAEVVMISGQGNINVAVKATKLGAFDFIEKPFSTDSLLNVIKNIIQNKKNNSKALRITDNEILIGVTPQIQYVRKLIENAAKSDARIFISGENGTGKEIIAKEIHSKSLRVNKPLVSINCAAIPENLIESELFGYVRGAFTGASGNKIGKFESADTGTLFLDEIADMSLATQAKVLRVLQEMRVTKIGDSEQKKVDVRVISATNKDINGEIKNGRFREDLFYRLNVIPFYLPALRERREDIPLFINHFIKKLSEENNLETKKISGDAMNFMMGYSWPGNVRQLRNIVERLIVMVDENTITRDDVKKYLNLEAIEKPVIFDNKYENYKLNAAKDEFEKDFIEKKLVENKFNISKTAKTLGIFPSNLHSKINKLGINLEKIKNMYYNS